MKYNSLDWLACLLARLYDRFSWGYSAFVKVALPSCNPCTIVGEESSLLRGM